MDPTLLRYSSAIREQKKCWELLAEKFDRFQTLRNKMQQHPTTCNGVCKRTQHVTSNNVASVCMGLKNKQLVLCKSFVLLKKHATNVFMMRILILEMKIAGEVGKRKIRELNYCAVDM